jgi:hypothetical protein
MLLCSSLQILSSMLWWCCSSLCSIGDGFCRVAFMLSISVLIVTMFFYQNVQVLDSGYPPFLVLTISRAWTIPDVKDVGRCHV